MGKSEGGYKLKKLLIFALFILSISLPLLGQTENTPDSTVAATVNGDVIYMDTFLSKVLPSYTEISKSIEAIDPMFSDILLNSEAGQRLLEEYEKRSLEILIEETLLMQYAESKGIKVDTASLRMTVNKSITDTLAEMNINKSDADLFYILRGYIDGLSSYEAKVVRDLAYKEALNTLYAAITGDLTVSEEEIAQFYQANASRYSVAEEKISIKLLQFDSFSEAYTAWKAASRDSNPMTVLDTFPDVQNRALTRAEVEGLNPDLVKSLFKTTRGELLSSVVTLGNKYAVIYLISYSPAGVKNLQEVSAEIENILLGEKKSMIWKLWQEQEFKPFKEAAIITRYYEN